MKTATPETLLEMARERTGGGWNNAGYWLAVQLHANGYSEGEALAVMDLFWPIEKHQPEARRIVKAEYKRKPKDPWTAGEGGLSGRDRRAAAVGRAFPTGPPDRRDSGPDPETVEGFRRASEGLRDIAETPAAAYLASRGIPAALARSAFVRYSPSWGIVGPAVVFPIKDAKGRAIAANGRAITSTTPDKQKRTYGPKRGGAFFTPGALRADPVAITEAPIDALTLALAGLPAIALCGASGLPDWLIRRLSGPAPTTLPGHSRTVYLAFDNDPPGEIAAAACGAALPLARTIRLRPGRKDWNEDVTEDGLDSVTACLAAHELPTDQGQDELPTDHHSQETGLQPDGCPDRCECGGREFRYEELAFNSTGGWVCLSCYAATRPLPRPADRPLPLP